MAGPAEPAFLYELETIANDPKILAKRTALLGVVSAETTHHDRIELRDQQVRIARYRLLEREVTDPLAIRLLHAIIEEL
ncbi:hypothetical protein ACVWXO_005450 [Bradyrhizobium sp. LM2.7]